MEEKNPENSQNQNDRLVLVSSIGTALYFVFLIGSTYFKIDNQVVNFVRELFTLPVILLLIVLMGMAGYGFSREKHKFSSRSFYSLMILILTVVTLILTI